MVTDMYKTYRELFLPNFDQQIQPQPCFTGSPHSLFIWVHFCHRAKTTEWFLSKRKPLKAIPQTEPWPIDLSEPSLQNKHQ